MKLNQREFLFISAGLVTILFLGIYFIGLQPLAEKRDKFEKLNLRVEKDLAEMKSLAGQYKALAAKQAQIDKKIQARDKSFAPFSFLELLAKKSALGQRIDSITPVASISNESMGMAEFELRLTDIDLGKLVRFLYSIETSDKVLVVKTLHLKPRYLSPDQIDVTMRVATPSPSS